MNNQSFEIKKKNREREKINKIIFNSNVISRDTIIYQFLMKF